MATSDDLKKYDRIRNSKIRTHRVNEAYMKGRNPTILEMEPIKEPDNRIPIPWAKSAVENMAGYAAMPGNIKVEYPFLDTTDDANMDNLYEKQVIEWQKMNEDHIEITELYIQTLAQGRAYEMWWADKGATGTEAIPRWKRVPGDQIVLVWDDGFEPKLIKAVYFWGNFEENEHHALILDKRKGEGWTKEEGGEWKRKSDFDLNYPYDRIPIIEFVGSMDREPFFQAQKEIIDAHDILISSSQNEVDRFNALISLFPGMVSKEFADKLKEYKVIDDLAQFDGDQWPRFLEKNLSGVKEFYNELADRLERLFHKTIKVPDVTSPDFAAGDESGVARAFKLLPMEFRAAMIEAYFNKGLIKRKELLDDVFKYNTSGVNPEEYITEVTSKRNIPVDELAKVQIAVQLTGIVSKETILKWLPNSIVPDYEAELARLLEEREMNPLLVDDEDDDVMGSLSLNGAQISAAQSIVEKVALGELPRPQAIELIVLLGIPREQAERIVPLEAEAVAAGV
jgi:SPP1 family phage portal protein